MEKGKFKKGKKLLSIILVPHFPGKVKVMKLSSLHFKLFSLLAVVITSIICVIIVMMQIINENNSLRENIAVLHSINSKQYELLSEKADAINKLIANEQSVSEIKSEFSKKYVTMVDTYIEQRIASSKASRSALNSSSNFNEDFRELSVILDALNTIDSSKTSGTASLADVQSKLYSYLEAMPTKWPASGRISSYFGERKDPFTGKKTYHNGLDIAASFGSNIKASASGKVTFSGTLNGYGLAVMIDHGYGTKTLYGHSSKLLVKENEYVKKGDIIAKVGNSGRSTGAHLHFEVRVADSPVDPLKYLEDSN